MKYVKVPVPVQLVNPQTKRPIKQAKEDGTTSDMDPMTAHAFLVNYVLGQQTIGKGVDGIRRVVKLDRAFDGCKPGDVVGVEDADYAVVLEILKTMELGSPVVMAQLLPFFESWETATSEKQKPANEQVAQA